LNLRCWRREQEVDAAEDGSWRKTRVSFGWSMMAVWRKRAKIEKPKVFRWGLGCLTTCDLL